MKVKTEHFRRAEQVPKGWERKGNGFSVAAYRILQVVAIPASLFDFGTGRGVPIKRRNVNFLHRFRRSLTGSSQSAIGALFDVATGE